MAVEQMNPCATLHLGQGHGDPRTVRFVFAPPRKSERFVGLNLLVFPCGVVALRPIEIETAVRLNRNPCILAQPLGQSHFVRPCVVHRFGCFIDELFERNFLGRHAILLVL